MQKSNNRLKHKKKIRCQQIILIPILLIGDSFLKLLSVCRDYRVIADTLFVYENET